MNALVFLYKRVLKHALEGRINAVLMICEEAAAIISLLDGTAQPVAKLLYGSGLRIMEAVATRVKDIDFQMKQLTVRSGKGDKDQFTTFPATLTSLLQKPGQVKTLHQQDLPQGHGEVYLPHASGSEVSEYRQGMGLTQHVLCFVLRAQASRLSRRNGGSMSSPPGTSPSTRVPLRVVSILMG